MVKIYFRYRLIVDYAVVAVAMIAHLGNEVLPINASLGFSNEKFAELSILLFQTSTSMLGFVLAVATFLIAHIQNEAFEYLRGSRSFPELHRIISSATWRLSALSAITMLTMMVNVEYYSYIQPIFISLLILSIFSIAALIWTVIRIISVPLR